MASWIAILREVRLDVLGSFDETRSLLEDTCAPSSQCCFLVYQYELAQTELIEGVVLVAYHPHVNVRVSVWVALAVS